MSLKEHEVLLQIDKVLNSKDAENNDIFESYTRLAKDYKLLLNQTKKLIRISDGTQLKIKLAQEALADQNAKINAKNKELKKLNSAIERYLAIINSELDIAAEYVRSILPKPIAAGNVLTNWRYEPSRQLGGDAFGYHWIDEDHFAVYLFDVCGHGVGPALHSVSALHALKYQILPVADFREPANVLASLNETFQMKDHNDMYFTIWYGVYNMATREVKYAAAGHHAAFLVLSDGSQKELFTRNLMIGVDPDFEYRQSSVTIDTPSSLYLFSDGVFEFEMEDGLIWTIEELHKFILDNRPKFSAKASTVSKNNIAELDDIYDYAIASSKEKKLRDDFSLLKVSFL